jgi:hypothetical protein
VDGSTLSSGTRELRLPRWLPRRLAWFALAGQLAFVAAWVIAGALQPGYSQTAQGLSELSARNAAHPAIMVAGFAVLGLSIAALAPGLLATLPARPATRVAAGLFALAGLAILVDAALPMDCGLTIDQGCVDRFEAGALSWTTTAHLWAGLVFDVAFAATPYAVARALWPRHASLLALLAASTALPILVVTVLLVHPHGGHAGLGQRLGFLAVHAWVAIVAIGVLHSTREARPRRGPVIPIRPRDFFGRAWQGRGELSFWPPVLWGRAARPFDFHREITWESDTVWMVEDRVTYADGERYVRRMIAELAGPDRVRVTADDMPGGAELHLEEGGYRISPYRLTLPIGPLRFVLRPRDEVRPAGDDGALDWTIRFSWLGLPVGKLRGVVRPAGDSAGEDA